MRSDKDATPCPAVGKSALLQAVPASAGRILEIGCAEGHLGAAIKAQVAGRKVFGIERKAAVAEKAAQCLDKVFVLDAEQAVPDLEDGSVDCILFEAALEQFVDAGSVLARYRRLLSPRGAVLCSVSNAQHHSLIAALVRGDFPYTTSGVLSATHLRFFTYATLIKLFLDAGYAPSILGTTHENDCPAPFLSALEPLQRSLGIRPLGTDKYLGAYQYIIRGTPLDYLGRGPSDAQANEALSFVVCVSNESTLQANLLSSPCIASGNHEVILQRDCRSAAHGLNAGIARAHNPIVVCVHQDVYLPAGWSERFVRQYRGAEARYGKPGVVGVYGTAKANDSTRMVGHVVDRDRLLRDGGELPAVVDTVDELLVGLPRDTPLRFDPALGFHFYGVDIALAAATTGRPAIVVDALCHHNSVNSDSSTTEFFRSELAFARKWKARLPVTTSCTTVDLSSCGIRARLMEGLHASRRFTSGALRQTSRMAGTGLRAARRAAGAVKRFCLRQSRAPQQASRRKLWV